MTSYTEYLALVESPVFAPDETRSHLDPTAAGMKRRIDAMHTNASDLGNGYYHSSDSPNDHFIYKHDGNAVKAFSNIVDGVQEMLYKDRDQSQDVPVNILHHALRIVGPVTSDATHTIGSKKFWLSVHDNFPGHRIESLNLNNGKSFDISKAQIHQFLARKHTDL